jgi:hypothetical protein
MYRELTALGAKPDVARQVAANSRRWWRNSGMLLNAVLTLNWADQLRPVSHDLNFSNRPVRTRMPGGVAGERSTRSPLCRSPLAALSVGSQQQFCERPQCRLVVASMNARTVLGTSSYST